jgi:hypothetical protein
VAVVVAEAVRVARAASLVRVVVRLNVVVCWYAGAVVVNVKEAARAARLHAAAAHTVVVPSLAV